MKLEHKKIRGFTMVEMMIVVAILGVLSAIAYPAYHAHVLKSNRAEAKVGLTETLQRMQRCFTTANTYMPAAGICSVVDQVTAADGIVTPRLNYRITVRNRTPTTFQLVATAINKQFNDLHCREFVLSHIGAGTATNVDAVDNTEECW